MNETKSLWKSKTFWFNTISGVIGVVGQIQGFLPPPALPYVAAVVAVGNIVLRMITDQPVSISGK